MWGLREPSLLTTGRNLEGKLTSTKTSPKKLDPGKGEPAWDILGPSHQGTKSDGFHVISWGQLSSLSVLWVPTLSQAGRLPAGCCKRIDKHFN